VRGAEVEIACRPATFANTQVIGDDSYDGRADLFVVLSVFKVPLLMSTLQRRSIVCSERYGEHQLRLVAGPQLGRVGQPQVPAENVDALLTAKSGGLVGDTGHRVHTRDTHGDIVIAELSRGRAEPFHKPPLLDVPLPPVGNDESDDRAHAAGHRERQLGDVDRVGSVCSRVDQDTKNPGCQHDYRDGASHGKTDRGQERKSPQRPTKSLATVGDQRPQLSKAHTRSGREQQGGGNTRNPPNHEVILVDASMIGLPIHRVEHLIR
jgi:hypothetical protein